MTDREWKVTMGAFEEAQKYHEEFMQKNGRMPTYIEYQMCCLESKHPEIKGMSIDEVREWLKNRRRGIGEVDGNDL